LFAAFYDRFPYNYFVVLFLVDRTYIASLVDILVIACILVIDSSFSVTQKLAQSRQNDILSCNSTNLPLELGKVRNYLLWSLLANIFSFCLLVWLFWTLESLLLFLLAYKYMDSFVSTLITFSEVQSMLYVFVKTDSAFEESYIKLVLESFKLLLEGSYVLAIVFNKKISISNYCTTIYLGARAALFTSDAWKAYKKIYRQRKISNNILSM
jgi:hypothetical protein